MASSGVTAGTAAGNSGAATSVTGLMTPASGSSTSGERQRVVIASALAQAADTLLTAARDIYGSGAAYAAGAYQITLPATALNGVIVYKKQ